MQGCTTLGQGVVLLQLVEDAATARVSPGLRGLRGRSDLGGGGLVVDGGGGGLLVLRGGLEVLLGLLGPQGHGGGSLGSGAVLLLLLLLGSNGAGSGGRGGNGGATGHGDSARDLSPGRKGHGSGHLDPARRGGAGAAGHFGLLHHLVVGGPGEVGLLLVGASLELGCGGGGCRAVLLGLGRGGGPELLGGGGGTVLLLLLLGSRGILLLLGGGGGTVLLGCGGGGVLLDRGGTGLLLPGLGRRLGTVLLLGGVLFGQRLVNQGGRGDGDALAGGLETVAIGAVLDGAHLAGVVYEAVLALDVAVGELGLDLEGAVGALEAIGVGTIVIVPEIKN